MEKVRVRLQLSAVGGLKRAQFLRLPFANVARESFVNEKIPDFLAALARVERLILRVADPAKLRIGLSRLGSVAIADDLEDAFALIDLLAQHRAEVASFGAEDFLPDGLVTEEGEGVGGELPAAPQLAADGGNKDERKRGHGR